MMNMTPRDITRTEILQILQPGVELTAVDITNRIGRVKKGTVLIWLRNLRRENLLVAKANHGNLQKIVYARKKV